MSKSAVSKPNKKEQSAVIKAYLTAYNALNVFGWAYCFFTVMKALIVGDNGLAVSPNDLYAQLTPVLQTVQTVALLEVIHAMTIVPSNPVTCLMQVMSRIVILWGYTVPVSHEHWSLYLLIGSWSLVEIFKYAYYIFPNSDLLFYPRYSLFAILYPTGISGEIIQLFYALPTYKETAPLFRLISYLILLIYIPGSPFMYFHMVSMRKKQFKKRKEAADLAKGIKPEVKVTQGIVFPADPETGVTSTLEVGKKILAASVAPVSPATEQAINAEKKFRFKYEQYYIDFVKIAAQNPKNAVTMASACLEKCYDTFQFVRGEYKDSLRNALDHFTGSFVKGELQGKGTPNDKVTISYKNKTLDGAQLSAQLDKWVAAGTIEPSCRDAIIWANTNKLDLSDKYFVVLGAGSAMGPLKLLLALGANIIALDLDRAPIWERILGMVENSASKVIFPMKSQPKSNSIADMAAVAGCNLFTDTPEAANFVAEMAQQLNQKVVIGSYCYMDSHLHVLVNLACDAIVRKTIATVGNDKVSLAYLCSPTDVFTVDKASYDATVASQKSAPFWQTLISKLRRNGIKSKNDAGEDVYIINGIVVDQGPNYALAKKIQHCRSVLEFTRGSTVSTNIAPSTATPSVVSNRSFALAYEGMSHFNLEVMYPDLSNTAMCALMISDVCNSDSPKNPTSTLGSELAKHRPMDLFSPGALHGGLWRMAYTMNSIGPVAACVGALTKYWYVPAALVGFAAACVTGTIPLP